MPASQPRTQPSPAAPRRKPRRARGIAILAAIIAVPAGLIAWFLASVYGGAPSVTARVTGTTVVSPGTLAVTIRVTNTGSAPASPLCTVDASSPSGTYSGANGGTLSPIPAGKTVTTVIDVTITGNGAQYATQATVSC